MVVIFTMQAKLSCAGFEIIYYVLHASPLFHLTRQIFPRFVYRTCGKKVELLARKIARCKLESQIAEEKLSLLFSRRS